MKGNTMKHLSDIEVPESGWDYDYTATHNLGDWRGEDIDAMLEGLWNQVYFEGHGSGENASLPSGWPRTFSPSSGGTSSAPSTHASKS